MPKQNILWFNWSTGKDSALALYKISQNKNFKITGLVTSLTSDFNRVSMHGVRRELLQLQAKNLNIPLYTVELPNPCSNELYQEKMAELLSKAENENVSHLGFGDLFLEDVRQYREESLKMTNFKAEFPLWKCDTSLLANEIISSGIKAIVTCIDLKKLPLSFLGREFNHAFLNDLPKDIDPCGEYGEFHTFVFEHPLFENKIKIKTGEIRQQEELFAWIDVIPYG